MRSQEAYSAGSTAPASWGRPGPIGLRLVGIMTNDAATPDPALPPVDQTDLAAVEAQLDRTPRGVRRIVHLCPCGNPDVVETAPRLPDGTPFPTLFYLTCPKAASAIGTLEASGLMKEMTE